MNLETRWILFLETIGNAIKVLAYFFNPKLREQKEKEKIIDEFKKLENEYRYALAIGDPARCAYFDRELRRMRAKYRYLA